MDLNLTSQEQELFLSLKRVMEDFFNLPPQPTFEQLQEHFFKNEPKVREILAILKQFWNKLSYDDENISKKRAILNYLTYFHRSFLSSCSQSRNFNNMMSLVSLVQNNFISKFQDLQTQFAYLETKDKLVKNDEALPRDAQSLGVFYIFYFANNFFRKFPYRKNLKDQDLFNAFAQTSFLFKAYSSQLERHLRAEV